MQLQEASSAAFTQGFCLKQIKEGSMPSKGIDALMRKKGWKASIPWYGIDALPNDLGLSATQQPGDKGIDALG